MNGWTPDDFEEGQTGPQFQWLSDRLTLHGVPVNDDQTTLRERVQMWQLKMGYRGTRKGGGADGFVGSIQLRQLKAAPGKPPAPEPKPTPKRIDRTNWKITNPDGTEVKQPEFETYENKPWFWETPEGEQVFRAPTSGGGTTPNTSYFRSETREMANQGLNKAAWGSHDPRRLQLEMAFTALPHVKQHAVGFQIHDKNDDVIMGRLEERKLFIESPYHDDVTLNSNYQLGTFFTVEIVPSEDGIKLIYNGEGFYLDGIVGDGWYYKYGCYCQAKAGQKWKGQTVPKDSFAETRFRGAVLLGG